MIYVCADLTWMMSVCASVRERGRGEERGRHTHVTGVLCVHLHVVS